MLLDIQDKISLMFSNLSLEKLESVLVYHSDAPMLFSSGLFFFLFNFSFFIMRCGNICWRGLYMSHSSLSIFIIRAVAFGLDCSFLQRHPIF